MARKRKPADATASLSTPAQSAPTEPPGKKIVCRRSPEWSEHHVKWQWLQDSYEGGQRYRQADYGYDRNGRPIRNLLRHRSECPDPLRNPTSINSLGSGPIGIANAAGQSSGIGNTPGSIGAAPGATAQDDDYEMRRARTAIPEFTSEAVAIHLSKIFDQEIHREGPPELIEWWKDVDGRGTPMDEYMQGVLAPQLLVNATMGGVLDRPRLAPGMRPPANLGEEKELGLDRCILSYILPQNLVWGLFDHAGNYVECVVREWHNTSDSQHGHNTDTVAADLRPNQSYYRHWTQTEWTLYNEDGSEVEDKGDNEYGYIPIVQLIDQPLPRQQTVGKSRYERVAGLQQVYYNVDSEMIISNVLQAHPVLSLPESMCKPDQSVPVGPGNILPMKELKGPGGHVSGYEKAAFISPDKDPFKSLRQYCLDLIDLKDTAACLTKPAGITGTSANAVSQSASSKTLDHNTGDKLLTAEAKTLARVERILAERAWRCLNPGKPLTKEIRAKIKIVYPGRFQLFGLSELCKMTMDLQSIVAAAGELPTSEGLLIKEILEQALPGMADVTYQAINKEIDEVMDSKSIFKDKHGELKVAAIESAQEAFEGSGSEESEGGNDPTGQSAQTNLNGVMNAIR